MSWAAKLEFAPVVTPDGETLTTLSDARAYLLEHPDDMVAGLLLKAAEHPCQLYLHCARQALSRAVHGEAAPVRKARETWRDRRRQSRRK